ncbi:crooked neck pre-mRNA splicing factor 1 [Homo sapiens]|uniref:Isoform 5 of Crooked neck-like protein 1 n=1 Tax=Homo sapiens TaxID=9606 RepID=Q9BZJ0-5|nr:CGI-201 protein, type IV [Homo sapiens]KAI2594212.1 crooked neck pre-mRNA splicing factor 1 [Homo sapiens]KAI4004920.1 crooked neck pre-mRNA splicing factor 1 [Homo sapiens]
MTATVENLTFQKDTLGNAVDKNILASLLVSTALPTSSAAPGRRTPRAAARRTRSLVTMETVPPPSRLKREVKGQ